MLGLRACGKGEGERGSGTDQSLARHTIVTSDGRLSRLQQPLLRPDHHFGVCYALSLFLDCCPKTSFHTKISDGPWISHVAVGFVWCFPLRRRALGRSKNNDSVYLSGLIQDLIKVLTKQKPKSGSQNPATENENKMAKERGKLEAAHEQVNLKHPLPETYIHKYIESKNCHCSKTTRHEEKEARGRTRPRPPHQPASRPCTRP